MGNSAFWLIAVKTNRRKIVEGFRKKINRYP
jgi:hypothetical protein